ncbi:hypothetical protein PVK06_024644 [Gossypium arboreum]|uniref:Uncharacterized protein n=1 Tax=Gossypium arboreum TaxID=29729 RepID=A0ABR0PEQ3_GOSAR|nr:hypothetical protein PVK06_024644 [Gossypium arboreum]
MQDKPQVCLGFDICYIWISLQFGVKEVGCLFFAEVGGGTYMQPLDGSSVVKVQVSVVENPEEASFFEPYEAAHSMHDLSSLIAQVHPLFLSLHTHTQRHI